MERLLSLARAWVDEDPDPETREELSALIEECADADEGACDTCSQLADRFSGTLQFGSVGFLLGKPRAEQMLFAGRQALGAADDEIGGGLVRSH